MNVQKKLIAAFKKRSSKIDILKLTSALAAHNLGAALSAIGISELEDDLKETKKDVIEEFVEAGKKGALGSDVQGVCLLSGMKPSVKSSVKAPKSIVKKLTIEQKKKLEYQALDKAKKADSIFSAEYSSLTSELSNLYGEIWDKPNSPLAPKLRALQEKVSALKKSAFEKYGDAALSPGKSVIIEAKEFEALPSGLSVSTYTEKETAIIQEYVSSSEDWNHGLRGIKGFKKISQKEIDTFDKLIERTSFKKDTTLYRGMDKETGQKLFSGSTFKDEGYLSTTLSRQLAEDFSGGDDFVVTIKVPKGFKGLSPNESITDWIKDTEFFTEDEVLLPRGLSWKVTRSGKKIILTPLKKGG